MSKQQGKAADSFKSLLTVASYQVSELIVQNMKAHNLGESLISPIRQKIVSTMLGNEAAMKISKITLSNDTVNRRILEISSDIEKNVCGNKLQCSDCALQADESTDIIKKAHLIALLLLLLLLLSTPLHQRAASRVQHPNHVAANSLSPQVARKGSTLSGFVQRSRLEREVGRDLHSNKWEEV